MTGPDPSESTEPLEDAIRSEHWLLRAVGGKFGYLLGALIVLLLTPPMIVQGWAWNLLIAAFASVVPAASLHAARPGRRSLMIGLALAFTDFGIGRLALIEGARWLVVMQAILW